MTITINPIGSDAKALLETLKTEPRYVSHHYDEANRVIVVTLKRWFGCGGNVAGLTQLRSDYITDDYLIPYSFKTTEDLA